MRVLAHRRAGRSLRVAGSAGRSLALQATSVRLLESAGDPNALDLDDRARPRGQRRGRNGGRRPDDAVPDDGAGRARRRHRFHSASRPTASKSLSPTQQALAYWLTQASIAIDPIIYDQLSRLRGAPEATARGNRRASSRHSAGARRQGTRLRAAVLGQSRQPQRNHRAEVPADVHLRGVEGRGAQDASGGGFKTVVRGLAAACDARRV